MYAQNSAQVLSSSDWRRSAPATVTPVGFPGKSGTVSAVVVNQKRRHPGDLGGKRPERRSGGLCELTPSDGSPPGTPRPRPARSPARTPAATLQAGGPTRPWPTAAITSTSSTPTTAISAPPPRPGRCSPSRRPARREAALSSRANGQSGQLDIRITNPTTSGAKYPDTVYQYQAGRRLVEGHPNRRMGHLDGRLLGVRERRSTVTLRACRDGGFCGDASEPTTLIPVNARAGIVSCVAGAGCRAPRRRRTRAARQISYQYSYQGALPGVWSAYTANRRSSRGCDRRPGEGERAVPAGPPVRGPRLRRGKLHAMIERAISSAFAEGAAL